MQFFIGNIFHCKKYPIWPSNFKGYQFKNLETIRVFSIIENTYFLKVT